MASTETDTSPEGPSYLADIGRIALGQQDFRGVWHDMDGGFVGIPSFCV